MTASTGKYKKPLKQRRFYAAPVRALFEHILKPIAQAFVIPDRDGTFDKGLRMLFNVDNREVWFCKVKVDFVMPGDSWATLRSPHPVVRGLGKRQIKKGDPVVVRVDVLMPERFCEIEHNEMIYVLTHAQWTIIEPKMEYIL